MILFFNKTNCQGAAICAVNQTWAALPGGWCMCNTMYGFTGLQCDQWCDQAIAFLVIDIIESCCAFALFLGSVYLLIRIIRHKPNRKVNPLVLTLMCTGIGMLSYLVATITSIVVTLGFPRLYIVSVDATSREIKRIPQSMEYANFILFALGYCISVCCFVILPLTWVREREWIGLSTCTGRRD